MESNETLAAYKLCLHLLHQHLPTELLFTLTFLAYTAYKQGSGPTERYYSLFQHNVQAGNKRVETVSAGLFAPDLESFATGSIKKTPLPTLKPPSACKAALMNKLVTPAPVEKPGDPKKTYDWKGQNGLNGKQVSSLQRWFKKGCLTCCTNDHPFEACPHLKDHHTITPKCNVGTA